MAQYSNIRKCMSILIKTVLSQPYIFSFAGAQTFKALLQEKMKGCNAELRILLTGKTGEGKSTLLNSITECRKKLAAEGGGGQRCTSEIQEYYFKDVKNGVSVKIFDTPGFRDSTGNEANYIAAMKKTCGEIHVVLYCFNMTSPRLTDDDKNAMKKLQAAFGNKFWKHVMIIFTKANNEKTDIRDDSRDTDRGEEPEDDDDDGWAKLEKERFEGRVALLKKDFIGYLKEQVLVKSSIAENIIFIPAGYTKKSRRNLQVNPLCLPDRENWLHSLLLEITVFVKDDLKLQKYNLNNSKSC